MENKSDLRALCFLGDGSGLKIDMCREEELYYHKDCYKIYQLRRIANELMLLRLLLKEREGAKQ